ncbi:MAG TPA: hypothetical protein PKV16_06030 [Caldisericia bacterium]|nr:hypothetical protein [Caldisericia bacterium]HPF49253.1 hypothetical protein [Caldisericia bacterium]HPI84067.1 hypothetical protein [Caldisericia bacterium]HPQ93325.1 hypothetical protein [Caldisericia bacterium]HRV75293.1 hypothetical protein [Caldisericia bacterium]
MKRIHTVGVLAVLVASILLVSCGSTSGPVWNSSEESIYNGFEELQANVESIMSQLDSFEPESFQDGKNLADVVWEWKNYTESSMKDAYGEWRSYAGMAIESKALRYRLKETTPNYESFVAKEKFNYEMWVVKTEEIRELVSSLK